MTMLMKTRAGGFSYRLGAVRPTSLSHVGEWRNTNESYNFDYHSCCMFPATLRSFLIDLQNVIRVALI